MTTFFYYIRKLQILSLEPNEAFKMLDYKQLGVLTVLYGGNLLLIVTEVPTLLNN